jgi:hypothetical protein
VNFIEEISILFAVMTGFLEDFNFYDEGEGRRKIDRSLPPDESQIRSDMSYL